MSEAKAKPVHTVIRVLRYFSSIVWRYRPSYVWLVAGNMLLRGLSPFVNIVLPKFIIDELLGQQRLNVLGYWVGALIGANFVVYLLNNGRDYLMNRAHFFFDRKLNELLGEQSMKMDFEYTENAAVLAQLEKAKTGVSWYSGGIRGLSDNLTNLVSGIIQLTGTLYIMATLSPWVIAWLLLIVALSMWLTGKVQQMEVRFMKDLVDINRRFGYYFNLLKDFRFGKDIRLYDASDMLLQRADGYIDDDWGVQQKRLRLANQFGVAQAALSTLQTIVLYGYLALRALAGAITIGELQMLVTAAGAFVGSITSALTHVLDLGKNADFMVEYLVFMEYPAAKASGTVAVPKQTDHGLALHNVSFRYPGAKANVLHDITLHVPPGQRLALVGPNGAGKTTLIKLLTRLYDPVDGHITLNGRDIREFDAEQFTALFSVVFQDYKLLSFSVRDNLTLGTQATDHTVTDALRLAGLDERINQLPKGMHTPVYKTFDKDGVEFSGGESQKLAIARAIYNDAPIVILDEPTAALDPVAEYEVYHRFDRLIGDKTAIYISHRLSSCRFCDQIAVLDEGRLVEYGSHDELLAHGGLYHALWHAQAQWYVSEGRGA